MLLYHVRIQESPYNKYQIRGHKMKNDNKGHRIRLHPQRRDAAASARQSTIQAMSRIAIPVSFIQRVKYIEEIETKLQLST